MATFMEAEAELITELGRTTPENAPAPIIEGWKFTALALRESYDGRSNKLRFLPQRAGKELR